MIGRSFAAPADGEALRRWTGVGLLFLAAVYFGRQVLLPWFRLESYVGDFVAYLEAARALAAGRSPYTVGTFLYPPPLAFVLIPLADFSDLAARQVWFWISQVSLLGAAVVVWRWLGGDRIALVAVFSVWALAGTVQENLVLGQVQPLLLLWFSAALWRVGQRPAGAMAWIGLAGAFKIWPAVLCGVAALQKRWRALLVGAVVGGGLVLASQGLLVAISEPPYRSASAGFTYGSPATPNLSAPAIALRLATVANAGERPVGYWARGTDSARFRLSPGLARLSLGVALLVGLLAGGVLWMHRSLPPDRLLLAALSFALVALPISWYHYQLLQFPALAWLLARALRGRRWWSVGGVVLLGFGLTGGFRLGRVFSWVGLPPEEVVGALWVATSVVALGATALGVWVLRATGRGRGDRPARGARTRRISDSPSGG
ncbi:MAG: glycosyltransferase family 87 protein [Acidobacteriota bacterium]